MLETRVQETVTIDDIGIHDTLLFHSNPEVPRVRDIPAKALDMQGLDADGVTQPL